MNHLLAILIPLLAGLVAAFLLRGRADARLALGAALATAAGTLAGVVWC